MSQNSRKRRKKPSRFEHQNGFPFWGDASFSPSFRCSNPHLHMHEGRSTPYSRDKLIPPQMTGILSMWINKTPTKLGWFFHSLLYTPEKLTTWNLKFTYTWTGKFIWTIQPIRVLEPQPFVENPFNGYINPPTKIGCIFPSWIRVPTNNERHFICTSSTVSPMDKTRVTSTKDTTM